MKFDTSQDWISIWPEGSANFTPVSSAGLWDAVTIKPIALPNFCARNALSTPHLQFCTTSKLKIKASIWIKDITWMDFKKVSLDFVTGITGIRPRVFQMTYLIVCVHTFHTNVIDHGNLGKRVIHMNRHSDVIGHKMHESIAAQFNSKHVVVTSMSMQLNLLQDSITYNGTLWM